MTSRHARHGTRDVAVTVALLALCALLSSSALTFAAAAVTVRHCNNSALVSDETTATNIIPSLVWESTTAQRGASVELSGTLHAPPYAVGAPVGFSYRCNASSAMLFFVWVDDHLVCHHGVYQNPDATMDGEIGTPLPFLSKTSLPVRVHMYLTDPLEQTHVEVAELVYWLSVEWCVVNVSTPYLPNGAAAPLSCSTPFSMIPPDSLTPQLSEVEEQRGALQRAEAVGWGTWLPGTILSVAHLPDGGVFTYGLFNETSGVHVTNDVVDDAHPVPNVTVRVGRHTVNHTYAQFYYAWCSINVSVEIFTDRGAPDRLTVLVTPVSCAENCDVLLWLSARFAWFRGGSASVENSGGLSIKYVPFGNLEGYTLYGNTTAVWSNTSSALVPLQTGAPVCFSTSFNCSFLPLSRRWTPPAAALAAPELSEELTAIEAALLWNYVYVPTELGPILPVSRSWDATRRVSNATRVDWGYILFEWDYYFASFMASRLSRGMCYSNLIQITRTKAARGFVPNICAGGAKSQDRTEPPVGAAMVKEVYDWFGESWVVELLLNDLLDWHSYFRDHRMLSNMCSADNASALVSLGSDPVYGYTSDPTVNTMEGARKESGITDSPMYDGHFFDNASYHLMEMYDVGFSSLVAREAQALASLIAVVGGSESLGERVARFAQAVSTAVVAHLWDADSGVFCNRMLNASFHNRISPTSFYPLLTSAPTLVQVETVCTAWLLNATRFCLSAEWPLHQTNTCYWGLPSISADDPAFPPLGYWRGYVWGPMAVLTYLGLSRYDTPGSVAARSALVTQMRETGLHMWREHRHICENFSPHRNATDCTGSWFYHWGALTLFLSVLEREKSRASSGLATDEGRSAVLIAVPVVVAVLCSFWAWTRWNQQRKECQHDRIRSVQHERSNLL